MTARNTPRKAAAKKAPAKKAAPKRATEVDQDAPDTGIWAQITKEAEALKGKNPEPRPFVIDDVEPPIYITAPNTIGRTTALAAMVSMDGEFDARNTVPVLRAMVGDDVWPRVWELLDGAPLEVLRVFMDKLQKHFNAEMGVGASMVPGKPLR